MPAARRLAATAPTVQLPLVKARLKAGAARAAPAGPRWWAPCCSSAAGPPGGPPPGPPTRPQVKTPAAPPSGPAAAPFGALSAGSLLLSGEAQGRARLRGRAVLEAHCRGVLGCSGVPLTSSAASRRCTRISLCSSCSCRTNVTCWNRISCRMKAQRSLPSRRISCCALLACVDFWRLLARAAALQESSSPELASSRPSLSATGSLVGRMP
ncbi:hypothetical protein V8C86DRAFT_2490406 [Haematococcus lacustris]